MQVIYRNRKHLDLDNTDDKCVVRWDSPVSKIKIECFQDLDYFRDLDLFPRKPSGNREFCIYLLCDLVV
jgi:hypothetical protein